MTEGLHREQQIGFAVVLGFTSAYMPAGALSLAGLDLPPISSLSYFVPAAAGSLLFTFLTLELSPRRDRRTNNAIQFGPFWKVASLIAGFVAVWACTRSVVSFSIGHNMVDHGPCYPITAFSPPEMCGQEDLLDHRRAEALALTDKLMLIVCTGTPALLISRRLQHRLRS